MIIPRSQARLAILIDVYFSQVRIVPDRRRRMIPEVVLVRRWVIGVLGIGGGRV
jgi:hypothetical protein